MVIGVGCRSITNSNSQTCEWWSDEMRITHTTHLSGQLNGQFCFFFVRVVVVFSSSLKWRRLPFSFPCVFAPWEKRRGNKFSPRESRYVQGEREGKFLSHTGHRHTYLYTCRVVGHRERWGNLSLQPEGKWDWTRKKVVFLFVGNDRQWMDGEWLGRRLFCLE